MRIAIVIPSLPSEKGAFPIDLRIRGPGDVAGIEQSGYLSFSIADPVRDAAILVKAREAAFALLTEEHRK